MFRPRTVLILMIAAMFATVSARADQIPKSLKGKIITSQRDIDIPEKNLAKRLARQDKEVIARSEGEHWLVYLVAFFNRPLPTEHLGIVVLDGKNEPVAVAQVGGSKGQTTLASHIVVDSTESPGQKHTIRVYYAKDGKPIVLAEKSIVLK